jgi:hypothetical protein
VRIYTFQTQKALDAATKLGAFRADPIEVVKYWDDVWDEMFKEAYTFINEEMKRRMPSYAGPYPMWAWAERPDLRSERHNFYDKSLLITADVPDERILLSDFGLYHVCLGGWYLSLTEKEDDEVSMLGELKPTNEQIKESWKRMFEINRKRSKEEIRWIGKSDKIQCCIDGIFMSEIVDIKRFKPGSPRNLRTKSNKKRTFVSPI